jgi:hypothetical protein
MFGGKVIERLWQNLPRIDGLELSGVPVYSNPQAHIPIISHFASLDIRFDGDRSSMRLTLAGIIDPTGFVAIRKCLFPFSTGNEVQRPSCSGSFL